MCIDVDKYSPFHPSHLYCGAILSSRRRVFDLILILIAIVLKIAMLLSSNQNEYREELDYFCGLLAHN